VVRWPLARWHRGGAFAFISARKCSTQPPVLPWTALQALWLLARSLLSSTNPISNPQEKPVQIKKTQIALLAALALANGAAFAQAAAPAAAEPDQTFAFNIGAVSDYRYRGISQSRLKPALQGGIDFTHKSGFYLGTWASSIKWIRDAGGDASVEVDVYGGFKNSYNGIGYDFGVLSYQYPGHNMPSASPTTTEIYAAGTFGPATLKYSHALSDLFGFANSKNSYYVDLNATFETGVWGLTLTPHVGYQKVKNNGDFSYTDWSIGVGKDFGNGFSASLTYVDTNNSNYRSPEGKDLGKATAVLGAKYTF
jgi:uncharacterized protein (TIGR02001 family)